MLIRRATRHLQALARRDSHPARAGARLTRTLMAAVVSGAIAASTGAAQGMAEPPTSQACLECHGQTHIGELGLIDRLPLATGPPPAAGEPDVARPGLFITAGMFEGTVHAELTCVECHRDAQVLPHPRVLEPVSCGAACHENARDDFISSVHGEALDLGRSLAPNCQDCHGTHEILPKSDRRSTVYPLNAARICGDCHDHHALPTSNGSDPAEIVDAYMASVHGRGVSQGGLVMAATCADCHGHHDTRRAGDPLARTSRDQIPQTCGTCHVGVLETFAASVHGRELAVSSELRPVCTDCHAGHRITRASSPEAHLDILTECGDCHDRPAMRGGRRASFYRTYRASYHGQVTELGSARAARCSDCHGAHDILPISDPASRLHEDNLVETCRTCHPRANARFAQFDPHADYRDRNHYPVLYAVWWYFIVVMSGAFGFFGLHSLLWLGRSAIEYVRHGPAPRPAPGARSVRRFTRLSRINHALIILTFFGLVFTGLPLFFAERVWAKSLVGLMGGVAQAGILHRVMAVLLMINFALHFYGLARAAHAYRGSWRQWLFGPNTMLPRTRDFRDCAAMFRWFMRGGKVPGFGRWTYWEKFDYWAEIGGSLIIGGSGLLLWFPEFFATFLPGWIFNVAMIVHGYEALLALGFIFTIHFFNAHLRRGKFPVDDVIFTGSVPEEELKHERPDEYERLVERNELDSLRVPGAPAWQRRVAIVVGVVAMAIGFILVALIVLAGLSAAWEIG
ncbi:MAG: hypothetical protein ACYTF9_04520 [Planctomycetota bacterium]|jgi:cytochrome b subunit of formate dehydrogenase